MTAEQKLRIGELYRYPRPKDPGPAEIDGRPNFFYVTHCPGMARAQLEKGIDPIGMVNGFEGSRRPAVLISSSPHKVGREITPWQDVFDTDNGHIRYFGDNKLPGVDPAASPGNKVLLRLFERHSAISAEERRQGAPLLFFRRQQKGFVYFEGYGVIERAELVTQYDRSQDVTFTNYVFDFLVLSLAKENETFDWEWIRRRRDPSFGVEKSEVKAPDSWKQWIRKGARQRKTATKGLQSDGTACGGAKAGIRIGRGSGITAGLRVLQQRAAAEASF